MQNHVVLDRVITALDFIFISWFISHLYVHKPLNSLWSSDTVLPCGIIGLYQHWFRKWPAAWWHRAITSSQPVLTCHLSSIKSVEIIWTCNFNQNFLEIILSLMQDCYNSNGLAMEILQFCTKASLSISQFYSWNDTFSRCHWINLILVEGMVTRSKC